MRSYGLLEWWMLLWIVVQYICLCALCKESMVVFFYGKWWSVFVHWLASVSFLSHLLGVPLCTLSSPILPYLHLLPIFTCTLAYLSHSCEHWFPLLMNIISILPNNMMIGKTWREFPLAKVCWCECGCERECDLRRVICIHYNICCDPVVCDCRLDIGYWCVYVCDLRLELIVLKYQMIWRVHNNNWLWSLSLM